MSCLWNSDTQTGVPSFFLIQITHQLTIHSKKHFKVHCTTINKHSVCTFTTTTTSFQTHNRNGLRRIPASKQAGRQAASKQMYTQRKKSENTYRQATTARSSQKQNTVIMNYIFNLNNLSVHRLLRQVQTRTNAMHTQPRQSLANRDVRDCVFLLNGVVVMTKTQAHQTLNLETCKIPIAGVMQLHSTHTYARLNLVWSKKCSILRLKCNSCCCCYDWDAEQNCAYYVDWSISFVLALFKPLLEWFDLDF